MAASKSYFPKSNRRFLPSDYQGFMMTSKDSFELDESDVWNSDAPSEFSKQSPRFSRNPSAPIGAASTPVNVPDWARILKHEYKENRRSDWIDGDAAGYYEEELEDGNRIPPHEYLARNRIASMSVQEGIGRTLKGRDLSRVRNAIWQKTGFQD